MCIINRLQDFVANEGRFDKGVEPSFGQPFYGEYMEQKIKKEFSVGNKVCITHRRRHCVATQEINGIILGIDYEIRLLISGKKVWNDGRNKQDIYFDEIADIKLIDNTADDFDLKKVDPKNINNLEPSVIDTSDYYEEHRVVAKQQFAKVYPGVDFDHSHIFAYACNCYYPFFSENLTAEVVISADGLDPIFVSCKTGRVYPNKNICAVYNFKGNTYEDCVTYAYLPDGEYKNVVISCVWTDANKKQVKIITLDIIDKLEKIQNDHNVYNIDRSTNSYLMFGEQLFEDDENASLLQSMMTWDTYFVMYPKEDEMYSIKASDSEDKYMAAANLAFHSYDLRAMLRSIVGNQTDMVSSCGEVFGKHHKFGSYFSDEWYRIYKPYDWHILSTEKK